MKLQNKKTGEIISSKELLTDEFMIDLFSKDFAYFNSKLNKIAKEWEDYEEPKEYWFIDEFGLVQKEIEYYYEENKEAVHDKRIAVGNYFETKEEAEKAVEKLKAFANLRKRGLKFDGWDENHHNLGIIEFSFPIVMESVWDFEKDLDLLFGGE